MDPQQPCWECRTRRLKCDYERPACNQCVSRDKTCPGYSKTRPVRFRPNRSTRDVERFNARHANRRSSSHEEYPPLVIRQIRHTDEFVVQAVIYSNEIRASWYRDSYLEGNAFDSQIRSLSNVPTATRHVVIIRALCHRISTTESPPSTPHVDGLYTRAHYHMGKAMRAVLDDFPAADALEALPQHKGIAVAILRLGLSELFLSLKPNWFPHFIAFQSLLQPTGELHHALRTQTISQLDILTYIMTVVAANTTSPAASIHFLTLNSADLECFLHEYNTGDYPPFPCPSTLFRHILKITELRAQMSSETSLKEVQIEAAERIIADINQFSPSIWLTTTDKTHRDLWYQIAIVYHLAVRLYAVGSLTKASRRSMEVLTQADRSSMLEIIQDMPREILVRYCLIWPVVMAGVYASSADQADITTLLLEISRECGMMTPLVAKDMLDRFRAFQASGWDDCFDQPHSFLA